MGKSARRAVLAATLSLTWVLGGLVMAAPAQAQTVGSGSLTFSGDPGDWISLGQSYSYATASGDQLTVSASTDDNHVGISLSGANGDWWYLDFAAPSGQPLASGTYDNATRYPLNGAGAGLSLDGNGRGCNTVTGTFTVTDAAFGPLGYVQEFDATFEQHCEGATDAARGEVHITNPAPPQPLALGLTVATDGTASTISGNATVHGTVTCTQPTSVTVSGTVVETILLRLVRGPFSTTVDCVPGAPVAWTGVAVPTGTTPFFIGKAQVDAQATGLDSNYQTTVTTSASTVVRLTRQN